MLSEEGIGLAEIGAGRAVVVVAHPDDEILGCGALLVHLSDVTVVHVTDGAPADGGDAQRHGFASPGAYAEARRAEAIAALALAGIGQDRVLRLGLIDQQVSLAMAALARALRPLMHIADFVLTHAYEGGHPDHDAVALAVHAACRLDPGGPVIVEMPFYHAGPDGWARQTFLPHPSAGAETVLHLDDDQGAAKRLMMDQHRTQADVLRGFDLGVERFRRAPDHEFTALPHDGPMLYERHGWNLSGPVWRQRAADALADLGLRT